MPMAMSNQAAFTHAHIDALRSPTTGVSSRCRGRLVTSPAVGPGAGGPGVTAGPGRRAVAGGPSSSGSPSHAASRPGSRPAPRAVARPPVFSPAAAKCRVGLNKARGYATSGGGKVFLRLIEFLPRSQHRREIGGAISILKEHDLQRAFRRVDTLLQKPHLLT